MEANNPVSSKELNTTEEIMTFIEHVNNSLREPDYSELEEKLTQYAKKNIIDDNNRMGLADQRRVLSEITSWITSLSDNLNNPKLYISPEGRRDIERIMARLEKFLVPLKQRIERKIQSKESNDLVDAKSKKPQISKEAFNSKLGQDGLATVVELLHKFQIVSTTVTIKHFEDILSGKNTEAISIKNNILLSHVLNELSTRSFIDRRWQSIAEKNAAFKGGKGAIIKAKNLSSSLQKNNHQSDEYKAIREKIAAIQ